MSQASTWAVQRAADGATDPDAFASRLNENLNAALSSHRGATRPTYAVNGTIWQDSDTDQVFVYDGSSDLQVAVNVGAPASAGAAGVAGDVAWDTDYVYLCTAANTWKRVAVATW